MTLDLCLAKPVRLAALFALALPTLGGCGDDVVEMPPPGCMNDGECTSPFLPFCDVPTGQCKACPAGASCGRDQVCRAAAKGYDCVEPCKTSADCEGAANTCCDKMCVSLQSPQHCGACGNACAGNMDCFMGQCRCPSRAPDSCSMMCVALDSDIKNCGTCGKDCGTTMNGYMGCEKGACKVAGCNTNYGNCDGSDANGCETNTSLDLMHCGTCGTVCPTPPNSAPLCRGGKCSFVCNENFRDCNVMTEDGCEINISNDRQHCGACNSSACMMGQTCVMGVCM